MAGGQATTRRSQVEPASACTQPPAAKRTLPLQVMQINTPSPSASSPSGMRGSWPLSGPVRNGQDRHMGGADLRAEADRLGAALRRLAPERVDPAPIITTGLPFHGASLRDLRALAANWHREHAGWPSQNVVGLVDELWCRAVREEMVLAAMIAGRRKDVRDAAVGLRRLDRWGRLLDNWETTDNLGGRLVGPWATDDPDGRLGLLGSLAGRRNPWLRRLALVGCVYLGRLPEAPDRWDRVSAIVLRLATDTEGAIPKAISWVLRSHLRHATPEVTAFLAEHAAGLPAIAVREARTKIVTGTKTGKRPPRRAGPG
jgi:3-methyladenine DNA glycosylase AlkD